jgi:mannose-6-phosphate isomerase-like protein (cupin superfamily)
VPRWHVVCMWGVGMKLKKLRLGKGFRVAIGNRHSQAAEMVLAAGKKEGGADNRHRGSDQWLYVLGGNGVALVNGERIRLAPKTLVLIERRDTHEIRNTGREPLRTLNFYVPPAYHEDGEELPRGRK